MSHISIGVLGVLAASLALGGVQFGMASDGSLARAMRGDASLRQNVNQQNIASAVNREAKANRGVVKPTPVETVTLSFPLRSLNNTSVAMRLPAAEAPRVAPVGSSRATKAKGVSPRKMSVACEPVVSVLTDVAKQLEPGRCVT
jgi:hypothetical protein